jgi:hypothetical protein
MKLVMHYRLTEKKNLTLFTQETSVAAHWPRKAMGFASIKDSVTEIINSLPVLYKLCKFRQNRSVMEDTLLFRT